MYYDTDVSPFLRNIEKIGAKVRYINLTVGAGTFQPVKAENIKDHKIHSEYISVSKELVTEIINTKKNMKNEL